jgi:hypothetical protein
MGLQKQKAKVLLHVLLVAEEEGFDFPQDKGGTRWHALGRYGRNLETKGFTVSPHKHYSAIIPIFLRFCSKA